MPVVRLRRIGRPIRIRPESSTMSESIASKALGVDVTIITVTERFQVYSGAVGYDLAWSGAVLDEYAQGQKKAADSILSGARQSAERLGVTADTLHVPDAEVAEAIIAAAKERNCGLIVMASHGRRDCEGVQAPTSSAMWEVGCPARSLSISATSLSCVARS